MEYTAITEEDKLALAKDLLRGRESDHYRISLLDEPAKEQRLTDLEAEIEGIRAAVEEQQALVDAQESAPSE